MKRLNKRKIVLHQTRVWGVNGDTPHTDFEIKTTSLKGLFAFITQQDIDVDTNPLFKVAVKQNRKSKK